MSETELEREVRRLLAEYGLYGYHNPDSRRSSPGWPDWVIVGRAVLYRELKSAWNGLSRDQWQVGHLLMEAGADWSIWRPVDLTGGRIERELVALADL